MAREWVDRVLSEIAAARPTTGDPALDALRTAILLEDAFGITLDDDEIDPVILGTVQSIRETVLARLASG